MDQDHVCLSRRSSLAQRLRRERNAVEARFRTLADHLDIGILIVDGRGEVVDINDRAASILGLARELQPSGRAGRCTGGVDVFRDDEVRALLKGGRARTAEQVNASCTVLHVPVGVGTYAETMYILPADAGRCTHR